MWVMSCSVLCVVFCSFIFTYSTASHVLMPLSEWCCELLNVLTVNSLSPDPRSTCPSVSPRPSFYLFLFLSFVSGVGLFSAEGLTQHCVFTLWATVCEFLLIRVSQIRDLLNLTALCLCLVTHTLIHIRPLDFLSSVVLMQFQLNIH